MCSILFVASHSPNTWINILLIFSCNSIILCIRLLRFQLKMHISLKLNIIFRWCLLWFGHHFHPANTYARSNLENPSRLWCWKIYWLWHSNVRWWLFECIMRTTTNINMKCCLTIDAIIPHCLRLDLVRVIKRSGEFNELACAKHTPVHLNETNTLHSLVFMLE